MKKKPVATRGITIGEITARVNQLAPKFFEGLSPSQLSAVLRAAKLRRFHAHSVLAIEGHRAEKLFLILEGRARATITTPKGEKIVLFWLPPGDISGTRAMLSRPIEYLVSTEAVTNGLALVWRRDDIQSLGKQYQQLLENALIFASDYVEVWRDLHLEASYHTARERVARVLHSLAKGMGRQVSEGIEFKVTNEELANEANVTIFTVSRLLSEWHRSGLLVKGRGRLTLSTNWSSALAGIDVTSRAGPRTLRKRNDELNSEEHPKR
jgi:CRP/FNR family transcriptional regulator, nitrogen oxide reductase regulator